MGWFMYAIYGGYFIMLYVQQQYFLHAHRRMSVDVLAVASLCTCSAQQIYSTKTRHVNIAMYLLC